MSNKVESAVIPLVEEDLKVGREIIETGRVRVRIEADERTETVADKLVNSDVTVERVPMDQEVGSIPAVRDEGDTIVVPVVEERLVKKLFLVEEVRMTRRSSTQEVNQEIKLRSQRAVVEREKSSGERSTEE